MPAKVTAYDFIVVGGGSGGSAVVGGAERERPLPRAAARGRRRRPLDLAQGAARRWLRCCSRIAACGGSTRSPRPSSRNRRMFWPRGRVLGGSSTVNGMLWVRGEPAEYDHWRDSATAGWGYDDVLPYLKRMEAYRRATGPRGARQGRSHHPLRPQYAGRRFPRGLRGGRRACDARLQRPPIRGRRLSAEQHQAMACVLAGARPICARHEGDPTCACAPARARTASASKKAALSGVDYRVGGEMYFARATREVILSAGAVQSPQLLELSGIGDKARLHELGIAVGRPPAGGRRELP